MEKITALYCRVSTNMQLAKGESIENQKARLKRYADASELHSRFYVDAGYSAKHIHRPQLKRFLSDVKRGKVQRVLVTKLDRITRSIRDLITLVGLFEDFGVSFQALDQSLDTSTASGRAQVQLLGVLAEWERNIISERVSEDMRYRAKNGKWNGGPVPFGYTTFRLELVRFHKAGTPEEKAFREAKSHCPEEKKLYPSPQDAPLVKQMFEEYLKRESIRGVTDWLNAQRYRSPKGTTWTNQSVSRILKCSTYVGKISYGRRPSQKSKKEEWIEAEGIHEPIIGQDIFDRVQRILKIRTSQPLRRDSQYLLSGVLRCVCGGKMHGYSHNRLTKKWRYYRCSNYSQKGREICKGNSVNRDMIEKTAKECLISLGDENILAKAHEAFTRLNDKVTEQKAFLNQEAERLRKANDLLSGNKMKRMDPDLYKNIVEIERIASSLEGLREIEKMTFGDIEIALKALREKWKKSNFENRKALIQSFIHSIRYEDANRPLEIAINLGSVFSDLSLPIDIVNLVEAEFSYKINVVFPQAWEKLPKPKTFGEHLRIARLKRDWLIKDLAAQLQVSSATVIHWEKMGARPEYSLLRKLKQIFSEIAMLDPVLIYADYPLKPKTSGEHLKKKRLHLDLSQKEMAERLGVSTDALRDWEAGRTHVKPVDLDKFLSI